MSAVTLPFSATYKPGTWVRVLIANLFLIVVGIVLVVVAFTGVRPALWQNILIGLIGFAVTVDGIANSVSAKKKFGPRDYIAMIVGTDGVTLSNTDVIPWGQIDSIEFAYTVTGSRFFQNLFYGMDDRLVTVRFNESSVTTDVKEALTKQNSEVFKEGLQTAFVTGLAGGTTTYIHLLLATEQAAPAGFPVTISSRDSSFLTKVEAARQSA